MTSPQPGAPRPTPPSPAAPYPTAQAQYPAAPPQYPAPGYPAADRYPAPAAYAAPQYPAPPRKTAGGLSITAFVFAFVASPIGLVLAIVALVIDAKRPDRSKGLSIAAIIVAVVLMLVAVAALVLWLLGAMVASVACGELAGGCPDGNPFF